MKILPSFLLNLSIIPSKQDQCCKETISQIFYWKYSFADPKKLLVYRGFDGLTRMLANGIKKMVFFQQAYEYFVKLVSFSYEYKAGHWFQREIKLLFCLVLGLLSFVKAIYLLFGIHTTRLYEGEVQNDDSHQAISHSLPPSSLNGLHFQAGFPQTIKYYRFLPKQYTKKKKNIESLSSRKAYDLLTNLLTKRCRLRNDLHLLELRISHHRRLKFA